MYQMIDEKLHIASCSLSDLTLKQVQEFLGGWEKGASIGSLTLFYDSKRRLVVLNRDNKDFEKYVDLVKNYSVLDDDGRKEAKEKAPGCIKETIKVLDSAIKRIRFQEELDQINNNSIQEKYSDFLYYMIAVENNPYVLERSAFLYGMACGKREERAKKKR